MSKLANLRTFIAVARLESFAAAARQLGVTPALVGRRIQALEDEHGARLIERTTRSQRLTELGQRFLAGAEAVVAATQELDDLTRQAPGELRGRIRMSAPATLGVTRLAAVVAEFCTAHPAVAVEMEISNRRVDLVGEGFDLAVRIGNLPPSGLIARRVGDYGFAVCAAPAYLAAHPAPARPEDLAGARCILNLNIVPRSQWSFIGPDGAAVVVEVSGGLLIDNDQAQREAALAGAGFAYLPRDLVIPDLTDGRLVEVLTDWPKLSLPIHVLHPSRRFVPPPVAMMIDAIAAGVGRLPGATPRRPAGGAATAGAARTAT